MIHKILFFSLTLLVIDPIGNLGRVAKANAVKKEAQTAFMEGRYEDAISKYHYLMDSLNVKDDNILLNLANAQYKISDTTNALQNFQKVTSSSDTKIKSTAFNQLGVMNNQPKTQEEALDYFKKAIKADPSNEKARYNYELLKKIMKEQEEQKKNNENKEDDKDQDKKDEEKKDKQQEKDQEKQDQKEENQDKGKEEDQNKDEQDKKENQEESEDQKDAEQSEQNDQEEKDPQQKEQQEEQGEKDDEEKEMPQSTFEKLQDMKISPDKAKMILEAMKNQEVQYIQQNRKKTKNRQKNNKPDW